MEFPTENKIFSVSEFITLLDIGLNKTKVKMIGEVSELKINSSGHVYFTLKDKKDGSVISCVIWKSNYQMYGIKLETGMEIIIYGYPNLHKIYGFKFIAETIELAGEGVLKKQYEELKKKLTAEGLFAEERKRPLPLYPQKIGLITSSKGDVLADFLFNIGKFGFKIKMIDSRVEGQEAVGDLLSAMKTFKKQDIEVLAIIRGGGSKEALEVFNNELLVREVASFPVPVIVAIGHHKDEPLIDFVADMSVSTPTAVATAISKSWNDLVLLLERQEKKIFSSFTAIFSRYKSIESRIMVSFEGFRNSLLNTKNSLKGYLESSLAGFKSLLSVIDQKLAEAEKIVFLNNPERNLRLGYSIASIRGKIIRRTGDAKIGDDVDLKVIDGKIISQVKNINKN